mgnify:FL=1
MALGEISTGLRKLFEPMKETADGRLDKLADIVKVTTEMYTQWDGETEKCVGVLNKMKEEQVRCCYLFYLYCLLITIPF